MGFHLLNVWISIRPQTLRLRLFSLVVWQKVKLKPLSEVLADVSVNPHPPVTSSFFLSFHRTDSFLEQSGHELPHAASAAALIPELWIGFPRPIPLPGWARYLQSRGGTSQLLLAHRSVSSSSPPVIVILDRSVAHNSLFRPSRAGEVHGFTFDAAARFAAIELR